MIAKLNSKKFFFSSTLALGVLTGVGIAAAPAQAGTLEWDNGTSSFIEQFYTNGTDISGGVFLPGEFDVTFSPESLGGQAAVFIASGDFVPPFPAIPPNPPEFFPINGGDGADATFSLVGGDAANTFTYQLVDDLTFDFGNDVSVTIAQGTTFLGDFDTTPGGVIEGLGFEEDVIEGVTVDIDGDIYTINDDPDNPLNVIGEDMVFSQAVGATEGGGYQAEVVVGEAVPEPTTILGLLAVGGLGMAMKRKKQS